VSSNGSVVAMVVLAANRIRVVLAAALPGPLLCTTTVTRSSLPDCHWSDWR